MTRIHHAQLPSGDAVGAPTAPASRIPGLALAFGIAAVATVVGRLVPIVGGPVTGIVLGILAAALIKPGGRLRPGIAVASTFVLQAAVVVLGTQLSLGQIFKVGLSSLPVMVGTLAVCLLAAYWIGRRLGVVGDVRTLIGVGTGICGASAIAAVTPVIGAVSVDVSYAISTIFLFNITAVLTFPPLGHLLGMSQHAFGLFAGTAVNDMSSVVAASTTYGSAAANYAVVVKLTRTLLIIPICMGLAAVVGRRSTAAAPQESGGLAPQESGGLSPEKSAGLGPEEPAQGTVQPQRSKFWLVKLVPWFLVGFLVAAAVNTTGVIPADVRSVLNQVSVFLITVALSAIGLSTDLPALRRAGHRPLLLGGCLWIVVSLTSLGLQYLAGVV